MAWTCRLSQLVLRPSPSRSQLVTRRYLNRVLFEDSEVIVSPHHDNDQQNLRVELPAEDARSKHIRDVLKLQVGDSIKCGVINRGICDSGSVLQLPTDGEEGSELQKVVIHIGQASQLQVVKAMPVDLILAVPRPLRLERVIPIIACLGVRRLFLVGAKKVEKPYFGSHLFRRASDLKALLIEGLSQASNDCNLPEVIVKRNLKSFVNQEFEQYFPSDDLKHTLQLIAHPPKPSTVDQSIRMHHLFDESTLCKLQKQHCDRVVMVIGPEGGWEDEEIGWFQSKGFNLVDLGPRILRTDIAVSLKHDYPHIMTNIACFDFLIRSLSC